jgi:hypothetical protein
MQRLISVFVLAVVACGSKSQPTTTSTTSNTATTNENSASEGPCGDWAGSSCDGGLVDSCTVKNAQGGSVTLVRTCVVASTLGPPCSQEIALDCREPATKLSVPTDLTDGCLVSPPKTSSHICIVSPQARLGGGSGYGVGSASH